MRKHAKISKTGRFRSNLLSTYEAIIRVGFHQEWLKFMEGRWYYFERQKRGKARPLGISVAGVGYPVERSEIIARENDYQLIE